MSYTLKHSDPTKTDIVVDPLTVDTSTSINLWGRGTTNWGHLEQENFLHMLENFASASAPSNPIEGQLWYDIGSTPNVLKVHNTSLGWVTSNGSGYGTSYPANPNVGDLWYDTALKILMICTATGPTVWDPIPYASSVKPTNPTIGQFWFDSSTKQLMICTSISPIVWSESSLPAAAAVAPTSPVPGQFWYDTGLQTLSYWNGTYWENLEGSNNASFSPPTNHPVGTLWYDLTNSLLKFWDGTVWEILSIHAVPTNPATGTPGQIIYNTTTNVLEYWDGTAWQEVVNTAALGVAVSAPANVDIGLSFPAIPSNGQLFYNDSVNGTAGLYVYSSATATWLLSTPRIPDWAPGIVFS